MKRPDFIPFVGGIGNQVWKVQQVVFHLPVRNGATARVLARKYTYPKKNSLAFRAKLAFFRRTLNIMKAPGKTRAQPARIARGREEVHRAAMVKVGKNRAK